MESKTLREPATASHAPIKPVSLYIDPVLIQRTQQHRMKLPSGSYSSLSVFVEQALAVYLNLLDHQFRAEEIRDE